MEDSRKKKIFVAKDVFLLFEESDGKYSFSSNDERLQKWAETVKTKRVKEEAIRHVVNAAKVYMKNPQQQTQSLSPSQKNDAVVSVAAFDANSIGGWHHDAVSALNQYCQKARLEAPKYKTSVVQGQGQNLVTIQLIMPDGTTRTASAANSKEAKKRAAGAYAKDVLKVKELSEEGQKEWQKAEAEARLREEMEEAASRAQYEESQRLWEQERPQREAEERAREQARRQNPPQTAMDAYYEYIDSHPRSGEAPAYTAEDYKLFFSQVKDINSKNYGNDDGQYYDKEGSLLYFALLETPAAVPGLLAHPEIKVDVRELQDFLDTIDVSDEVRSSNSVMNQFAACLDKAGVTMADIMGGDKATDMLKTFYSGEFSDGRYDKKYGVDQNTNKFVELMLNVPGVDVNATLENYSLMTRIVARGNIDLVKKAVALPQTSKETIAQVATQLEEYYEYSNCKYDDFNDGQKECLAYLREVEQNGKPALTKEPAKPKADALTVEEFKLALEGEDFTVFVRQAHEQGRLAALLPEVDKLWSVPEKEQYHPEGNAGAHTLLVLEEGKNLSPQVKFALLLHDVGKTLTPQDKWPSHIGHDGAGVPLVEDICQRLQMPENYTDFALFFCKNHMKAHNLTQMKVGKVYDFAEEIPAQNFDDFLAASKCDVGGRGAQTPEQVEARKAALDTFAIGENRLRTIRNITAEQKKQSGTKEMSGDAFRQHMLNAVLKGKSV